MSAFSGGRKQVAIALESSRGVGIAPVYQLGKLEFGHDDKIDAAANEESHGHIADAESHHVLEQYAQGGFSGNLGANSAAWLLSMALGAVSSGSPTDSVTAHTITLNNNNQHKSASLVVKDPNATRMFKLAMLENLEISVNLEDMVSFDAEFVSKRSVASTQSIPTQANDYKFTKKGVSIKVANDISGLGAATKLSLKELTLNISKNTRRDGSIGTAEPEDIHNLQISIEGSFRLNHNDSTFRNNMLNGTKKAMRIAMTTDELIGVSAYGSLEIDLAKVYFTEWEQEDPNDDIAAETVSFKAFYDPTNGLVESCVVNNAIASL